MNDEPAPPAQPLLRVVKGDPTPEELAALVAVVSTRPTAAGAAPSPRRSEWGAHHRTLRQTHRHGPGAWRAAALPDR
ncbi:MAG: acyl-CoA carboxylase subunit epsilon [Propionibacteriales bacterium]|nr:acyl-CoA carboxylase subunit epsilon [Propionibacteriales bacterium]